MEKIKDIIQQHIENVDRQMDFLGFTEKRLTEWFEPLLNTIRDDGAIAYLIGTNERYRASPLASTLEWLDCANLLPRRATEILEDKLVFLRDDAESNDKCAGWKAKNDEDSLGWSLSEGASVWSTSVAIISLFDSYNVWEKHSDTIAESVVWLSTQNNTKDTNSGWAYQNCDNCKVNAIMTALALRAIAKALQNKDKLNFAKTDEEKLRRALISGFHYLKDNVVTDRYFSYWTFNEIKHCTATTWALLALYEIIKIDGYDEVKSFYKEHHDKAIRFVLSKIPQKSDRWADEKMVEEGGAKYNKQKNYYSFCVALLPQLFTLGLSPYHPKVISQIAWIIKNRKEWRIKEYDQTQICSFTYAMVLATLCKWATLVGSVNAKILINSQSRCNKALKFFYGFGNDYNSVVRIVSTKRIHRLILILILVVAFFIFKDKILSLSKVFLNIALSFIGKNLENSISSVLLNIISTIIYTVSAFIICKLMNLVKVFWRGKFG